MGRFKYSEEQQHINNVLKYHDDQLTEMVKESRQDRNEVDAEIEALEMFLRKKGIDPSKAAKAPSNSAARTCVTQSLLIEHKQSISLRSSIAF